MGETGKREEPKIRIDLTKPRDKRPLSGLDIEQWRGEYGLIKYDASHALGFRNTNHYNAECRRTALKLETELLLRIYMEYPGARAWEKFQLPELFELMYGPDLRPFVGTEMETQAWVDLADRFTQLFGKSTNRKYEWLLTKKPANAYIDAILSKLKTVPDPKAVLERISKKCLSLRGFDLDKEYPVPTLANPPTREKTGRRPSNAPAKKVAAKALSAQGPAKKVPAKKVTPKATGRKPQAAKAAAAR